MKIVDLKCPSCGGKLVPMEGNPKIVVCEYCNSQFVLEEDKVINYHIHQYGSGGTGAGTGTGSPVCPPGRNVPIQQVPDTSSGGSKAVAAVAAGLGIAAVIFIGVGISGRSKPFSGGQVEVDFTTAADYLADGKEEDGIDGAADSVKASLGEPSPLYEEMVKGMFGKSADLVTDQDLEKVKYISVEKGSETATVKYSLDDPYETAEFREVSLELVAADWKPEDLARFSGLVKVDTGYNWPGAAVFGSLENLKGLSCSGVEIPEVVDGVEPEQLVELCLARVESLEGLSAFENLEILSLEDVCAPDIRQLTPLKKLKSLSIVEDDPDPFSMGESNTLTDYSGLSVLTGLETLHLESEFIREFSFLKPLANLKELSIEDSEAIGVEPLAELSQLESLRLIDNDSVRDYSPVGTLTNLKSLTLDKSTSQDDPDLSSLGNLISLDVSGFMSVAGIGKLGNLKELSVHGCNIDEIKALAALSGLEKFSCYSVWTYAVPLKNVNFIDGMTGLRCLDFSGSRSDSWGSFQNNMEILGDISNVLNHPGLEELYLNNCMYEIDFGKLTENPSLKVLEMRDASLKENFYVESSGGMTNLWYDDVTMDEHMDFLAHYPNLEKLYLDGNQLTNIQFAASLKNLTHLGLNNNYVTDLSPLNQAENLWYLDVRQNPVGNVDIGADITVLK